MAMEIVQREEACSKMNSKCKSSRTVKITLEDYLHFFDSRSFSDFSINYLNQIMAMHGYKRIHKSPKKVLIEAMSAIALTNPCRSTLNDKISPSESAAAAMTMESVINDLNELNWQECTITSIEAIASNSQSLTLASPSAAAGGPAGPKRHPAKGLKSKRIALKPKGNEIVSASGEGKRSKKKKKKLRDCKGCVSSEDL